MKGKRFFSYILFTFLIVLVIVGIRSIVTERKQFQKAVQYQIEILSSFGEVMSKELSPAHFSDPGLAEAFCGQFAEAEDLHVSLLSLRGGFVGDSHELPSHRGNKGDSFAFKDALATGSGSGLQFNPVFAGQAVYIDIAVYAETGEPAGVLEISRPVSETRVDTRSLVIGNLVTTILLISSTLSIGYLIIRSFYKPITALREAATHYGKRDFAFDPHVEKPEEMRVLSETMKTMAANLRSRINVIEQQRNELEMILSSMIEAVIVLDPHLIIRKINKMGLTLLNMNREEVENRSLIEIFRNSELYEFATQILFEPGPRETSISIFANTSSPPADEGPFSEKGRLLYLQVHGTSMRNDGKNDTDASVLLVLHDITKMKALENMRKDFVANVSHELKTPITSIKGFVETLLAGAVKDPSKAVHFLEIIEKHTNRLNSIIDDLLSLSRLEQFENIELEFKRFSLSSIIGRAVAVCANKAARKEITVTVEAAENITAEINPQLIEQALVNLIDNAVKYSEHGSTVTIVLKKENSHVSISIIDNGCGIPPQSLDRVFERFYRVDRARSRDLGGTGLGLAIVKHIALSHNGEAFAESEPGKGSTFSLLLPEEQPRAHE